jgi:hypothetical protein
VRGNQSTDNPDLSGTHVTRNASTVLLLLVLGLIMCGLSLRFLNLHDPRLGLLLRPGQLDLLADGRFLEELVVNPEQYCLSDKNFVKWNLRSVAVSVLLLIFNAMF